ncbi:MAG: NADH-quinone oxidoreductase subunit C [Clostridia bacterium]|nr:NADH-quinone oxidoreductase subunit C [Clostridia bacterium]
MREKYVLVDLTPDLVPLKVLKAKQAGARLVQMCCANTEDGYDLLYSFADGYHFVNYKIHLLKDEEIVSISNIYPSASLYENEMSELFGVNVSYIGLDYRNELYNIDTVTPFRPEEKEDGE